MLTIKQVREAASKAGKSLIYNRLTGEYQIVHGFDASVGEIPFCNGNGKLSLNEHQLKKLLSYV